MKTISMDFKEYEKEIEQKRNEGYQDCVSDVSDLFRLIFVKCDKEDSWFKIHEIFDKAEAKKICEYLGIEEMNRDSI